MAKVNLCYHKQTNTWWTDGEFNGLDLVNYIKEYPIGLGAIEMDTDNKQDILNTFNYLQEVMSIFIPDYIKKFNGISQEIEKNGFENAKKVSKRKLKKILKNS